MTAHGKLPAARRQGVIRHCAHCERGGQKKAAKPEGLPLEPFF